MKWFVFILTAALSTAWNRPAAAQFTTPPVPPALKEVDFEQNLDARLPLDTAFLDDTGAVVTLGGYFNAGKPVILVMAYYECPMLCQMVMQDLVASLVKLPYNVGKDLDVVIVSIDPKETPELAAAKKATLVEAYGRDGSAAGWHLLTGKEEDILAVADVIGFRFAYDPVTKQFAHPAGIVMATPAGRVSRYFYGTAFPERDMRLGIVESSEGKIGLPVDRILLSCYHYDPLTGKYGFAVMNALRIGGSVTVLAIATFVVFALRRERQRLREVAA